MRLACRGHGGSFEQRQGAKSANVRTMTAEPNSNERIVFSRLGGVLDYITPSRPSYRDLAAQLEGRQAGRVADSQHRSQQFGLRQDGLRYCNHYPSVCKSKTPGDWGAWGLLPFASQGYSARLGMSGG